MGIPTKSPSVAILLTFASPMNPRKKPKHPSQRWLGSEEAHSGTKPAPGDSTEYSELSDVLPDDLIVPEIQKENVIDWIDQEYRKARG
jgi:hypothetical protein